MLYETKTQNAGELAGELAYFVSHRRDFSKYRRLQKVPVVNPTT